MLQGKALPLSPLPASGIRDNRERGAVGDFLKSKLQPGAELSVISAYFTIYAYQALKQRLDGIAGLRFLFGEPSFIKALDPEKTANKAFRIEEDALELAHRLHQKRAAADCAEWVREKVEIRSVKQSNLLHGKMYHIARNEVEDAILGSSNFTVRGLGLGSANNNIELNLEVDSSRDRRDLKSWFDSLWSDAALVKDVKQEVLLYLEQLYRNQSPEFVYYKTLYHVFEKYLEDQDRARLLSERSQIVDTDIWNALFEFQKDGVKGAINKILRHNGCILADSVGLGKTYEALAVIKYFELLNCRVLVLCPKKLRENWAIYQAHAGNVLNPFPDDRFGFTILHHTDLSREGGSSNGIDLANFNWGAYDLVVVDESHNFRNNARGRRDESGEIVRLSRYERLMEDIIKAGIRTKVLLISATPVNNDLKDLRNQLYFLTEGKDDAFGQSLGIGSLKETLAGAQRAFSEWARRDGERKTAELLERLSSAFFTLLDELTIARSRKHIQKYYAQTVEQLGGFPKRLKPISLAPDIDSRGRFMSYDRLNSEILKYRLSLFNPARYVLDEHQSRYAGSAVRNFTQSDRESYLVAMMKVNFLKRLESSVHSFAITMQRTTAKIEKLRARIKRFEAYSAENPELDLGEMADEEMLQDEDLRQALEVGGKFPYRMAHLDLQRWDRDLKDDFDGLHSLYLGAREVTPERDLKLARLREFIGGKATRPTTDKEGHPNRKVLVFTAFADTAEYLYEQVHGWASSELSIHTALVTGGGANRTTFGKNDFNHILTNFSPRSHKRHMMRGLPTEGEIDLLIATDCVSEGQNLQDCDYLVNYDIHWNPVRIIQRFGRIDRIGSINPNVQLVNFWPTADLNQYINLKSRVEARMALVDIAATVDDNLLKPEDIDDLIKDDLTYRDKQLLRLHDEVLDMEDFNESAALVDFNLDDFRADLMKYIEANRRLLEEAPLGLYAVVPADPRYPVVVPGVIFCLRQQEGAAQSGMVNPLQRYFLVYVRDDRVVRFGFAQPKQVLDVWRSLSQGKSSACEDLCNLFDQETDNGNRMDRYSDLLGAARDSIARTFRRRVLGGLQDGRGGVIPPRAEQVSEDSEFELISWLVIRAP